MQIGPYQTAQIVEEDGLSTVYLARHDQTGQPGILTYIKPGSARSIEDWVAWLRIVKGLDHPNILVYNDGGRTADGGLYIAGPHVPTALKPNAPLTVNQ